MARAGRDLVRAKNELLSHATSHAHVKACKKLALALTRRVVLIIRKLHRQSKTPATRHDRCLVQRHCAFRVQSDEGMARLVVRRQLAALVAHAERLSLRSHENFVFRVLEVLERHRLSVLGGSVDRGDVHQVAELGSAEPGRAAREHVQVNILVEHHLCAVQLKNLLSSFHVWIRNHHVAVETTWPHERLIKALREVGRRDDNDSLRRVEAVQLHEQLVESHLHVLLILWIAAAADRVNLVDKYDARRVAPLRRLEQIAHATRADADEHLLELRTRAVEKWDTRLARHSLREQSLARARRPDEENALRQLATQSRELGWRLEKLDNLDELRLRLVASLDVLKARLRLDGGCDVATPHKRAR
mmetsp:Transcript_13870/g.36847  ORF Transcript_13870/g.36847 Transcript_13870/m.36847 type:complete len:361 (-) Transcript_13870:789-1871(-)